MPSKKRATPVSLQPLDALFGTNEETTNGISEIAIGSLHPFTNHPFHLITLVKIVVGWKFVAKEEGISIFSENR